MGSKFYARSFGESFRKVCETGKFSQFDIMMNILWSSPFRDEYSWYIRDQKQAHHPAFQQRLTVSDTVLRKDDYSAPKIGLMKHAGHGGETKERDIRAYICTYDHL